MRGDQRSEANPDPHYLPRAGPTTSIGRGVHCVIDQILEGYVLEVTGRIAMRPRMVQEGGVASGRKDSRRNRLGSALAMVLREAVTKDHDGRVRPLSAVGHCIQRAAVRFEKSALLGPCAFLARSQRQHITPRTIH